ncbi:putative F-box protein At3g10430 [Salvia hispanica]|uniref:putative F-box protein At3g10430 n=1 Tax=Salvia hispanica TaxID=49212 RepID=UPI002009AA4D|nr:putative F-box protein At3g10430 [Salvia hispanica]
MNIDVVFEILLHLPVRSLLRFIAVHKSWYYIINSPDFRKLYNLRRKNNKDEEVYLCFISDFSRPQVSLNLLDNGKSLMWYYFQHNDQRKFKYASVSVSGAVKGLVCISSPYVLGLAISNPFLGQLKNLPLPLCASTHRRQNLYAHHVGLGFDEDYKVVQLLLCTVHSCLHANLYSARTNSWRELDRHQDLIIQKPIKSVCKNGSFAHWEGLTRTECKKIILSFDMKNEVFRTIKISGTGDQVLDNYFRSFKDFTIFAKGECSFVILVMDKYKLKVYESSGEGSEVIWNNVNNVSLYYFWKCNFGWTYDIPFWRNNSCVVLKGRTSREVILYDYRVRNIIKCFKMCGRWATGDEIMEYKIIEYEGSLISP